MTFNILICDESLKTILKKEELNLSTFDEAILKLENTTFKSTNTYLIIFSTDNINNYDTNLSYSYVISSKYGKNPDFIERSQISFKESEDAYNNAFLKYGKDYIIEIFYDDDEYYWKIFSKYPQEILQFNDTLFDSPKQAVDYYNSFEDAPNCPVNFYISCKQK